MPEEWFQLLVCQALERRLGLAPWRWWREVPTRDGSRADLVYCHRGRAVGFEMKLADDGALSRGLASRDLRQLRHYKAACDAVYLVTLAVPCGYTVDTDMRVRAEEPPEAQLLPEGVGWIMVDRMTLEAAVLRPAPELTPVLCDRVAMLDAMDARTTGMARAVRLARAS